MKFENIATAVHNKVGLVTLNRPDALNALSDALMNELGQAVRQFDDEETIGAIVITGSEKAFAAGADIKGMVDKNYVDAYLGDFVGERWNAIANCRTPTIAAVSGYALGGGCELAMMCDFIIAAQNAKFGQPEIKLGIIPGSGGTQRLTRFVGKSKAMEMCLTGRMMEADEAERSGLVSRVVPTNELLQDALRTAQEISNLSRPSVLMSKEAVNRSYETTLSEGINAERALFLSLFATNDQVEGMTAFIEKREPNWSNT